MFGEINKLNYIGKTAETELLKITEHYNCVKIDKYVVMPNHIHIIVVIDYNCTAERSRPFPTLSKIIGLYKSGVAKQIHKQYPNFEVWQKSFYDTIIRNERAYNEIVKYIEENPDKWESDEYFKR